MAPDVAVATGDCLEPHAQVADDLLHGRCNYRRSLKADFQFHCVNYHPLVSVFKGHPAHPIPRRDRQLIIAWALCYSVCGTWLFDYLRLCNSAKAGQTKDQFEAENSTSVFVTSILYITIPVMVVQAYLSVVFAKITHPENSTTRKSAFQCWRKSTVCFFSWTLVYLLFFSVAAFALFFVSEMQLEGEWRCVSSATATNNGDPVDPDWVKDTRGRLKLGDHFTGTDPTLGPACVYMKDKQQSSKAIFYRFVGHSNHTRYPARAPTSYSDIVLIKKFRLILGNRDRRASMRNLFDELDTSSRESSSVHTLDVDELKLGLGVWTRLSSVHMTDAEVVQLFIIMDADRSGDIEFDEFTNNEFIRSSCAAGSYIRPLDVGTSWPGAVSSGLHTGQDKCQAQCAMPSHPGIAATIYTNDTGGNDCDHWDWRACAWAIITSVLQAWAYWFLTAAPKFYLRWQLEGGNGPVLQRGTPIRPWMRLVARALMWPKPVWQSHAVAPELDEAAGGSQVEAPSLAAAEAAARAADAQVIAPKKSRPTHFSCCWPYTFPQVLCAGLGTAASMFLLISVIAYFTNQNNSSTFSPGKHTNDDHHNAEYERLCGAISD
jgi:hypothetical protein